MKLIMVILLFPRFRELRNLGTKKRNTARIKAQQAALQN